MPDPKLNTAIEEIREVLKRHDIAGMVFLGSPTHTEFLMELSPTWSCVRIEGDQLRFRSKKEDFPSLEAQKICTTESTGMLFGFFNALEVQIGNLLNVTRALAAHFEITHTDTPEPETFKSAKVKP